MIPGKEVEIGGKKYTLPPINMPSLRRHAKFLGNLSSFADGAMLPTTGDVLEMSEIIFESLMRNHPDADRDEIEEYLGLDKIVELFAAIWPSATRS